MKRMLGTKTVYLTSSLQLFWEVDTDRDLYYQDNLRLFKMKSRAAMTLVFRTKTVALLVS